MNTGLPESPEDRLLDELLREQSHGPDEAYLRRIEAAVDARHLPVEVQRPTSGSNKWLARLPLRPQRPETRDQMENLTHRQHIRSFKILAIAAGIALVTGAGLWWRSADQPADAPTMTGTEPQSATPTLVKPERSKSVAEAPRKNRLAPPIPMDAPNRGMTDERMAANHNLPEPNPFGAMSKLPSLPTNNPTGGALTGSGNGKLLARFPGQAADNRAEFADLVRNPTGDGNYGLPAPVEIIPKGVPKGSNIKEHYGQAPQMRDTPVPPSPRP